MTPYPHTLELVQLELSGLGDLHPTRLEARAEIGRLVSLGYGPTAIAASLNRRGISTPSGRGRWYPNTVYRFADARARAAHAAYMREYRRRGR